jgi:PAS domain S-box-containing protein
MNDLPVQTPPRKPPLWLSLALAAAMVGLMGWLRLGVYGRSSFPIGFGAPIVVIVLAQRRWLIWSMVVIFVAMTAVKFFFINIGPQASSLTDRLVHLAMVMADLFLIAYIADLLVRRRLEVQLRGMELAARNEEIGRQNEELRNQSEELEQQSEELRVANDGLVTRQRISEAMLELSRSMTPDMTRGTVFTAIFQAMQRLMPVLLGAVIWERDGEELRIAFHHGFGDDGPDISRIPRQKAFANLIIEHDRTGYLEDIALRPDLKIPQPRNGSGFKAVIASPLQMRGQGTRILEVYSATKHAWTAEEVLLVEKMAAQASISMTSSDLFSEVDDEHRRLQAILDTVPFGISSVNPGATKIQINAAGAALLGVPREMEGVQFGWPTVGKVLRDGKELKNEEYTTVRALRGEASGPVELELKFHDGRTVFILVSAAPIRDRWGTVIAAVAAYVDITSQKKMQQELEIRRQEAEETSVKKTRFLGAVSHDIRTPANAIGLIAELIRRSASDPTLADDIPELAEELQNSSASLVNLISDVLDLTRLDIGRVDLNETEFELSQWLSDECRQLQPLAADKKLKFEWQAPAAPSRIHGDRVKLSRVLVNLVGNAIKFTDAGEVTVVAKVMGDGAVEVSVRDTGVGIAAENQARIFDEFLQLKNSSQNRVKGSGLGLSICKRLIERMGGKLDLVSAPGQGSTFTFLLPSAAVVV